MRRIAWILAAIPVFGVAVGSVMLGWNMLPPGSLAEKLGTTIPWVMAWSLIWITAVAAVIIAIVLIVTGLSTPAHDSAPEEDRPRRNVVGADPTGAR